MRIKPFYVLLSVSLLSTQVGFAQAGKAGRLAKAAAQSKPSSLAIRDLGKWQRFNGNWYLRGVFPPAGQMPVRVRFTPFPTITRQVVPVISNGLKPWARQIPFPGKREHIQAVIFDLDGTLLDSLRAWENSGSNFVRAEGFEPPADLDEKLVAMSLMDGAALLKEMYQLPYSLEEILQRTLRPIKEHYYQDIQPMPGVVPLLAALKAQGIKMAVATASYKDYAQAALTRLGLADYFEFIITCDEVGVGKSDPKVYEVAAQRLGVSKEHTLVAEDALHALQTAHKAGFKTAGIEEAHSAHQRAEKQAVSNYYVISYQGINTLVK